MEHRNDTGATPEWLARQAENPHFISDNRPNRLVNLNKLDPAALTLEVLTLPLRPDGWTLTHTFAYCKQLSQLPRAFHKMEVLGQKDGHYRRTVYDTDRRG